MKRFQWLMVFLAFVPVLLFAYTGQFSRLLTDDDCRHGELRNRGAWDALLYMISQEGRHTSFLLTILVVPLDTHGPSITIAVMILLWLVGWYGLVVQGLAFLKIDHSRRALSAAIAALIVAAAINAFYTWESLYAFAPLLTHTTPIVLFTVYMALALWIAPRLRKNIPSLLRVTASGAACFLIAGFSEAHVVYQLIFLTFCLLMSFALLRSSVRRPYALVFGVGWLATLASLIAQLTSPEVAARLARDMIKLGLPDRSLSTVTSKTLAWSFQHINDPEVFTGFLMLMGVGLLIALGAYKPRRLSKTLKPLKLASPVLWLCLLFHLVCMPLLWGSTSGNPYIWDAPASNDGVILALNNLFILSFLVMLWQRKRINVQLRKRSPGWLFLWWLMAAACIFVLLFALTQPNTLYFYSSIYLFASLLVFLVALTSLHTGAEERKLGLLALGSYGLGAVSILAIVFMLAFARGFIDARTLAAGACLLVFSGLVWGIYIGCLAKRYLPSLPAGQAWIGFLKAASLFIVIIIAVSIAANQAALIPAYQNFAKVWDANHQKILVAVREGKDLVEIPPLPLHSHLYLRGCPGKYYRSGPLEIVLEDGSYRYPSP